MNALRVGIACNIKTDRDSETQAEFDEPGTVDAISNALQEYGCETIIMEATEAFPQKLAAEKPDIVFN
ncbi:MAG: D-alanine--D-alanine ligase, partial [Clostridiales bacterium]|nr:D-alanine--D-alanine ligase [Clostridiales bacterium]